MSEQIDNASPLTDSGQVQQPTNSLPVPASSRPLGPAQPPTAPAQTDPASQPATPNVASTAGLTADDRDVIEKDWVDKVKQVIDSHQGDPFKQTEALNLLKADYMKKRYNKIIRVDK